MFIMHRPFSRRPDGLLWTQNTEYEWRTYEGLIIEKDTMGPLRKQLAEYLCEINSYYCLVPPHVNCTSLDPIRSLTGEPIDWTHPMWQDS